MKPEHRRSVRLKIENGLAVLHVADVPSIGCEILDLSENGCLCCVAPLTVTQEVAAIWKAVLIPGAKLETAVSRPPQIRNVELDAIITHCHPQPSGEIHVGMRFDADDAQRHLLSGALLKIAAAKLYAAPTPVASAVPEQKPDESGDEHEPLLKASRLRNALLAAEGLSPGFDDIEIEEKSPLRDIHINNLLLRNPDVTALDLCHALSIESRLPVIDLDIADVRKPVKSLFSYLTMLRFQFVPFEASKDLVCVAAVSPLPLPVVMQLERIAQRHVLVFLAPADKIHELQFKLRPSTPMSDHAATRIKHSSPLSYYFCDMRTMNLDGKTREGVTLSIAENGAVIKGQSETAYVPEDLVNNGGLLRICINPKTAPIRITAKIRQVQKMEPGTWVYGLEFTQMSADDSRKLSELYQGALFDKFKLQPQTVVAV